MDDQEKALEELDTKRLRTLAAYASIFLNSVDGPQIMADLKAALDQPTYRPGRSTDEVIWREGRRSVYLDIVAAIGAGSEAIEQFSSEPQAVAEGVGAAGDPLD